MGQDAETCKRITTQSNKRYHCWACRKWNILYQGQHKCCRLELKGFLLLKGFVSVDKPEFMHVSSSHILRLKGAIKFWYFLPVPPKPSDERIWNWHLMWTMRLRTCLEKTCFMRKMFNYSVSNTGDSESPSRLCYWLNKHLSHVFTII